MSRDLVVNYEIIVAAVEQHLRSLSLINDNEIVYDVTEGPNNYLVSLKKE